MSERIYYAEKKKLYRLAIAKWGPQLQVDMLIEEMSELTHILLHMRRRKIWVRLESLAEEIADVEIMLEQLKYALYNCSSLVATIKNEKLQRLKKMLEESN